MRVLANRQTPPRSLGEWIDSLQARGRYVFSRDEAQREIGCSSGALQAAARRLIKKQRVVAPRRGLFVVVPLEYRSAGAPPPTWFIGELMEHAGRPYYVGLLTAASLHGAAHQQPQEFQVLTDVPMRPTQAGRARIRFFTKRFLERTPTLSVKTETGSIRVSTPEATALDLVRYVGQVGQLHNVATVVRDLAERMDAHRLVEAASADVELSCVQRLGFLLDYLGESRRADALARWVHEQKPRIVSLRPDRPSEGAMRNGRWSLLVNAAVEPDE